jgi:hypothetical protein
MTFVRRLGETKTESPGGRRCPEIWETDTGDIAVIGREITREVQKNLPDGVIVGAEEKVVLIPRTVLEQASRKL